jgi:hypothetical protein
MTQVAQVSYTMR